MIAIHNLCIIRKQVNTCIIDKKEKNMNIHFASVVHGNQKNYQKIVDAIKKKDHLLVTDHYLTQTIEGIENESEEEARKFHNDFVKWLKKADIILYDISKNDINSGYEITHAISMKKPVILLFEKGTISTPYVFKGVDSDLIQLVEYTIEDIDYYVSEAIEFAEKLLNIRFNLILTPNQNHYLEEKSKILFKPKSAIIRDMLNKEMVKEGVISEQDLDSSYQIE